MIKLVFHNIAFSREGYRRGKGRIAEVLGRGEDWGRRNMSKCVQYFPNYYVYWPLLKMGRKRFSKTRERERERERERLNVSTKKNCFSEDG